ncbi:hypothetical protein DFQ28_008077 [Apophysomyces sp. BC1034]|nr:hypothetical protein DFQ28_008077 [Apophysomyces sp. BC1034]
MENNNTGRNTLNNDVSPVDIPRNGSVSRAPTSPSTCPHRLNQQSYTIPEFTVGSVPCKRPVPWPSQMIRLFKSSDNRSELEDLELSVDDDEEMLIFRMDDDPTRKNLET